HRALTTDTLRRSPPRSLANHTPLQNRRDNIVTILENVGFDYQIFANDALDRRTPAINQRLHVVDDHRWKRLSHALQSTEIHLKRKDKSGCSALMSNYPRQHAAFSSRIWAIAIYAEK